jgi:hypothetical protein
MWNRADLQKDSIRCLQQQEIGSCKVQKKKKKVRNYWPAPPSPLGLYGYDVQVHEKCNEESKTSCRSADSTSSSRIISLRSPMPSLEMLANGDYHYHLKA